MIRLNQFFHLPPNRWLAGSLLVVFVVLFAATFLEFGGGMPLRPEDPDAQSVQPMPPTPAEVVDLFTTNPVARFSQLVSTNNPFYTAFFEPPPAPPPKEEPPKPDPEPPKPPPARKVKITYQGFFKGPAGVPKVFIKLDDQLVVGGLGASVVEGWVVEGFGNRSLTLKDSTGQTNIFPFNVPQTLELPAK